MIFRKRIFSASTSPGHFVFLLLSCDTLLKPFHFKGGQIPYGSAESNQFENELWDAPNLQKLVIVTKYALTYVLSVCGATRQLKLVTTVEMSGCQIRNCANSNESLLWCCLLRCA